MRSMPLTTATRSLYTADGGHLNVVARRIVAERLLEFLARLPAP